MLAVGSTVIDLTPTPLKEWAIAALRHATTRRCWSARCSSACSLLAAVAGLLARRRFVLGAGLLVVLVAVAAARRAQPARGRASPTCVPSLAAAVAGVASAVAGSTAPRRGPARRRPATPRTAPPAAPSRRGVLVAAGVLAAAAAAMGGAGRWITSYRTRPENVDLPAAADPAPSASRPAWTTGSPASRRSGPRTTTSTASTPGSTLPVVSVDDWTLTIDGDVDQEVSFSFDDLARDAR